jgi:hypothetical protein
MWLQTQIKREMAAVGFQWMNGRIGGTGDSHGRKPEECRNLQFQLSTHIDQYPYPSYEEIDTSIRLQPSKTAASIYICTVQSLPRASCYTLQARKQVRRTERCKTVTCLNPRSVPLAPRWFQAVGNTSRNINELKIYQLKTNPSD